MAATAGEPVRIYEARYLRRRDCSANEVGGRQPKPRGGGGSSSSRKVLVSLPECNKKSAASTAAQDRLDLSSCSLDSVNATLGLDDDGDLADMLVPTDEELSEHWLENDSSLSLMRVAQAESVAKSVVDEDVMRGDPTGHPIKSVLVSCRTARKSFSSRTQPARKVAAVAKSVLGHRGKNGLVNGSLIKSSQLRSKGATSCSVMSPKDMFGDSHGEITIGHQRPNDILGTFPVNVAESRLPLVVLNQVPVAESANNEAQLFTSIRYKQYCDILDVQYGPSGSSCGGDPSRPPSALSSSLRKVELGKSHLEPLDAELGVLLPKLSEMEMVLTGNDAWQSDGSLSPEMPILSPNIVGGEPMDLVDGPNFSGRMPVCDVQAVLGDEDLECHRLDEEATLLDDGEPRWKRPRKEIIRPFGSRKVKSWMQRRKCRLSCPDIDVVDGMEFLSFECEKDLERFMRNNPGRLCRPRSPQPVSPSAASTSSSSVFPELLAHLLMNGQPTKSVKGFGRAIMPTKTTDITLIKGWRNKIFAVEALSKCRFDPNVVRKLSWSQRMCLLSNFSREELEERGLLDLMSMSCSQYAKGEDIADVNSGEPSISKTLEPPDVDVDVHISLSSRINNAISPVNNENPVSNASPVNNANPVHGPTTSSAICGVSPVCSPSPVRNASPTKSSPMSKTSSGSPVKGIREIYDPNSEENESYLLDDFSKEVTIVHEDELDRQSIESIDLGIFKSEPFDDEDLIEQPTADIPDPLVSVSPNPAFVQDALPNKSVFVSEYLDNFLKNQSTLNVSLTKSMEKTVNPDEIQTKVVWPTQEMPVHSEVPARALFGERMRAQVAKRNPVGRPRLKPSGGVRGRYNKKFIMKPRGRPRKSVYKVKPRANTVQQCAVDRPANGAHAVTMSRAHALFALTALVRRNYVDGDDCDSYMLDTPEDIEEAMHQVCTPTDSVQHNRKLKCNEFSVLVSKKHALRAVAAVIDFPERTSPWPHSSEPPMSASSNERRSATDDDDDDNQDTVNDKPIPRLWENNSPMTAWKVIPVSPPRLPQSLLPTITLTKVSTVSTVKPHGVVANGCQEEFCRMGCICDSLKVRKRRRGHCGKVCCMFGCSCDTHPFGTTDQSDHSNNTYTRASRRREIKLPARLRDSVYFYKEDLTVVNVTKAVQGKKFKKMLLMSSVQASTSPSPPPPPPQWTSISAALPTMPSSSTTQGLSASRNQQNSSDPVKNFVRRPQMYPLAFRKSKIKQISRVEAEAYEHLKQSRSPPVQPKKKRIQNKNVNDGDGEGNGCFIFKPQLGIRPRMVRPPVLLLGPDDQSLSKMSSSPSIPDEEPSVSAANRPKLMDLQKMKYVNPVVKPAASRSIPAILRRSLGTSRSSPHKNLPASACTATVQRVLLKKLRLPHGTDGGDDGDEDQEEEEPLPEPPKKIVSPVHRFGIRTARKSLNPSALCRAALPKSVKSRTSADRVDIVVKNLMEEIVRKVAFQLEAGDFWQMPDNNVRRARISCFRSASSSVVQQLPFRKKLQQHQMTVKTSSSASLRSGEQRASKTMSLAPPTRKKSTPSLQSAPAQRQPQLAAADESDDEILCVGRVENVPPKPIARVAGGAQQKISTSSPPKHAKGHREQQRRNAILMAFTNLAMVSSPVVKDIWSKKDESVPITAFVFKMSSAAIQRLQDQEKSLYVVKQGLIRRRMLLFNKYSEYLKDYEPEKQRIAIRELSKKISECCHDRSEPSSSTDSGVALPAHMMNPSSISMLPISVVRIPPVSSMSRIIPHTSVPSVSSVSVSSVSIPSVGVASQKMTPPKTINLSGGSMPSDEDVDVLEVMPKGRPAGKSAVDTVNKFGEGDVVGMVGSNRILVGEPMLIGGVTGVNPRTAGVAEAGVSGEPNEDAVGPMRTIRLQRPVGGTEWVAVNSSRETANQGVGSTVIPPLPRILKFNVSGMHKKEQSLTGTSASLAASAPTVVSTPARVSTPAGVATSNVAVKTNSTNIFNTRTVPVPSIRCTTNVVTSTTPVGTGTTAVLKPSIPTLFTFTSSSGYCQAMTKLLLNPVNLSGVRLMSPNNVTTTTTAAVAMSAAAATTKTLTGVDFTNAGKLVMRARTFRPVPVGPTATTTMATIPIPSDNVASTDTPKSFVRVPLLQAFGNSGKDNSGAKYVIGMIPKTSVSSATDSTTSSGLIMSPCVTQKRQQQQQLVTIPIPVVGRSFTLDNQQGILIMKANHASPAVGSTTSDQLTERAAVAKSDGQETVMTTAQKLIQHASAVQTVSLLVTPSNNDNNSASSLSPVAADQNNVQVQKGHSSVYAPRRPCYCPVPPSTRTTIKAAVEDKKLPSRNPPIAAVAVATTTTTTKTTVIAGTKPAAQVLPAVSPTAVPTTMAAIAGSKLAPLNPVAASSDVVPAASMTTIGVNATNVSESITAACPK